MNTQEKKNNKLMMALIAIGIAIGICLGVIAYLINSGKMRSGATKEKNIVEAMTDSNLWTEGLNILNGTFHFNGADYGFTVRVYYDATSKRIRSAIYSPDNTGNNIPLNGALYLSSDGAQLTLSGSNTDIQVTGSARTGMYHGSMVRGDHYGTCTIQLR